MNNTIGQVRINHERSWSGRNHGRHTECFWKALYERAWTLRGLGRPVRPRRGLAAWAGLAAASWSALAFAQPSAGPAQVDPRLRPTPAPPSTGAPIQTPAPSQTPVAPGAEGTRFTLSGVDFE